MSRRSSAEENRLNIGKDDHSIEKSGLTTEEIVQKQNPEVEKEENEKMEEMEEKEEKNTETADENDMSKKKRKGSFGSNIQNEDKSCHESGEEQKSKGIRIYIDREHDSDNRESTKDVRRDYRRNDKRDQKRSDQRDDNSDHEKYSDSKKIHDKILSKKLGTVRKQKSVDDTQFQSNKELQKDAELQNDNEFQNDKKKCKTFNRKDDSKDIKNLSCNSKSQRKYDSKSDKRSNEAISDDNKEFNDSPTKDYLKNTSQNKKSSRDSSSSNEKRILKRFKRYYRTSKKVKCVFEPQNEAGVAYINKELMIKYIQYYYPDTQNVEQLVKIIPKKEYENFCKEREFENGECSCTNKKECDLHYFGKIDFQDEYENGEAENCVVIIMDTRQIDCQKMKKIVENAVFREDYKYLEEISEQFIEFLKENIDVTYNNKTKKLKLIPCELRLDQQTIQIKFIYDRNLHKNSKFLINAIKAKYDSFNVYDVMFVSYSYLSSKKKMFKDFFQSNDDIKALESLKPYYDYIQFEIRKEECIIAIMKKYLKAECEGKTKRDLMNLIMIQIKIIEDCSVIYDEMIEQVFIRNAKFHHPIYKCSNPAFTVSFKLASKSIFLTTLDQTQKANVETVKQEMITKIKEIFSDYCTLKASYLFPLEKLNECKAEIWKINGSSISDILDVINNILANEITTVYSEELKTDCDFSCIQLSENDTPNFMRQQYVLINYSFYFTSVDNKANFEKKLMSEEQKDNKSNRCSINECIIIDEKIEYWRNIKKEHYREFCEFLNERKKEIMKTFLFKHFEPTQDCIAIRGSKSKITEFSKKNKKGKYDEHQFGKVIIEFNQNHTSVESIKITSEFLDLIEKFPSVLYNSTVLEKIKKISLTNALNFNSVEYYKHDKFTQEIVNGTIGWFITFCAEVNWKMNKNDKANINYENVKINIDFVNFIESLFSFKVTKNEDIRTEEINYQEINDKYIWITEDEDDKYEIVSSKRIIYELECKFMQKKYPYIKIDRQNISKQEKKEKKIKESEGFINKEFNICFLDKESVYEKTQVISLDINFNKEMMIKNFISGKGEIIASVYDHVNKSSMILRRLESFEELKNYSPIKSKDKISSKVLKGECECNKEHCVCHLKFIHPKIPTKEFEEDLDLFDGGEENKECTFDNFKFQIEKEKVIKSLRTYAFEFSNTTSTDIQLEVTATNENMKEISENISSLVEKPKKKQKKLEITISGNEEKYVIYDKCAAEIVKVWLKDKDQEKDFEELSYRVNNPSFEFDSAWTIVVIGIIELLSLIATQNRYEKDMLFDEIWLSQFKQAFKEAKKIITEKSNEIASRNEGDSNIKNQEIVDLISKCYIKTIETIPVFHQIKDLGTINIFDKETNTLLKKLLRKFKNPDIRLIKNFPITLVAKGIGQFCKNYKTFNYRRQIIFETETKALIFKEFEDKVSKGEFKEYQVEAEKFCKAEIYSYILYTAFEYEMVKLNKLDEREFKQAIIIIADVCFFKNEELIPYIHPKMLLILESKSSNKSKEDKKNKDESSEEDSEEEIDTKKNKKDKGKKNKKDDSDSDGDGDSSDERAKKKKAKKESSDNENDSDDDSDNDSDSNSNNHAKGKRRKKKSNSDSESESSNSESSNSESSNSDA